MKKKIVQCFMWKLQDIECNLEEFKKQGFTHILTSPLEVLKEKLIDNWFVLYQPIEWKLGNELGGSKELTSLVSKSKEIGITIMVDVIISHVANKFGGHLELEPHSLVPYSKELYRIKNNISDFNNRFENTQFNNHLPFLNHYKKEVSELANKYIDELEKCGVEAIRLDSARHIPLREDGCRFLDDVFKNRNMYVMSEVIFDTEEMCKKYARYGSSFTNEYYFNCDDLVSSPLSHDDYLTFGDNKTDDDIIKRYEYILSINRDVLLYLKPYSEIWKRKEIKEINKKY